jgi:hypothetical protein
LCGSAAVGSIVLPHPVHADSASVERVRNVTRHADALIAVGSGTINDLCKYASALDNKPYAVFATAPSMNGYTSVNAAITVAGHKKSLPAQAAQGVFMDLEVLAAAPPRMIRAGLGDSLCRPTAQADWLLAHHLRGDSYQRLPFDLLAPDEADLFAEPQALLAGDIDAFANFPAPEALPQFEADPRFTVAKGSTEGETILSTNNGKKPFDDIRVRQAMAHAIDRQAIIDGAMFGLGTPIGSHFAPHHPAYLDLTGTYPYDLDKARALLAEAGYPEGFEATLKLPPPTYARRGGEIIADQLGKIGIKLEIIPVEWAQWLDQAFKGKDYDLTIVSHTEPMDIGIYARDDYYFDYHNPKFNEVTDNLAAETDTQKRYALMGEAQTILANDAVNGFLFELAKTGIWNAKVEGLWENSPVQANDLTEVHWTE